MTLYADSEYPVRTEIDETHAAQLDHLADPGTWGNAALRLAVAREIREACYEAGVQEKHGGAGPESDVELPGAAREMIRHLAVSPQDFDQQSYESARSGGLSDEEYVEIVGIVSRLTCMDVFARGVGVPLRPVPAAREGKASGARPGVAKKELAWVPTVPQPPGRRRGGQGHLRRGLSAIHPALPQPGAGRVPSVGGAGRGAIPADEEYHDQGLPAP